MDVFSYGGGVQSTAALVLAAQGQLDVDAFLFCNVGEDSEHPATLRYVHEIAMPYAAAQGIRLEELYRHKRDGSIETLHQRIMHANKTIPIPVRLDKSGKPANRACTVDFKRRVVRKWLIEHGGRRQHTVQFGISLDEWKRMRMSDDPLIMHVYPLVVMRLTRQDCLNIIERAGLPEPPKSSCFFCPYHRLSTWREMRDNEPELFAKAVAVEHQVQRIAAKRGDMVWMTDKRQPLPMAIEGSQPSLFDDDMCESGYCVA